MTNIRQSLLVFFLLATWCKASDVFDVCQLLSDPKDIGTGTVKIRGVYGSSEEYSLIGSTKCGQEFDHKGKTWWPGVWLNFPGGGKPPTNSEFDYAAFDVLEKAHKDARAKGLHVSATFEGTLKYCPQRVRSKAGETWIGCGFLGHYVLQLTATTVSDVRIE